MTRNLGIEGESLYYGEWHEHTFLLFPNHPKNLFFASVMLSPLEEELSFLWSLQNEMGSGLRTPLWRGGATNGFSHSMGRDSQHPDAWSFVIGDLNFV